MRHLVLCLAKPGTLYDLVKIFTYIKYHPDISKNHSSNYILKEKSSPPQKVITKSFGVFWRMSDFYFFETANCWYLHHFYKNIEDPVVT